MKIILYVNVDRYGEVEVETEQEHLERIQNWFDDEMSDFSDGFEEYLSENYSHTALFQMNEIDQSSVLVEYRQRYFEEFDTNYHWGKIEKEIEIGG